MSPFRIFLMAFAATAGSVVAMAALDRMKPAAVVRPAVSQLSPGISVRDQIQLGDVKSLRDSGFRTLIDLRPDGEASDQPASSDVERAAAEAGMTFAYVPTPHGAIPDAIVDGLARALADAPQPVILYCRSGNRAARVWALAEASRPSGADAKGIAGSVRAAGQKVDDLMPQIEARIAARKPS